VGAGGAAGEGEAMTNTFTVDFIPKPDPMFVRPMEDDECDD
jgi:hypothetical protein